MRITHNEQPLSKKTEFFTLSPQKGYNGFMTHTIYYFTGTGNSLWTARELKKNFKGAELVSIPSVSGKKIEKTNFAGIVFPVYMHRVPYLVADFIKTLPDIKYLYAVAVNGGDVGLTFSHFKKQLYPFSGRLKAGFSIITPNNYLPFGEAVSGEKRERIFNTARAKIKRISGIVQNQISSFDKEANFFHTHLFPGILYSTGYKFIHFLDKNFSVEETCNSCGICEKICPVKNIILTEGKPVWNKNCQMCFACINNCPQNAIQYGGKTRGLKRYRNPEISLSDLIN